MPHRIRIHHGKKIQISFFQRSDLIVFTQPGIAAIYIIHPIKQGTLIHHSPVFRTYRISLLHDVEILIHVFLPFLHQSDIYFKPKPALLQSSAQLSQIFPQSHKSKSRSIFSHASALHFSMPDDTLLSYQPSLFLQAVAAAAGVPDSTISVW